MSKRSRQFFESFQELNKLCDDIDSPPQQKKRKLNPIENNKETTPNKNTKHDPLLSDSPSPPSILIDQMKSKLITTRTETGILYDLSLRPPQLSLNNTKTGSKLTPRPLNIDEIFCNQQFYVTNHNNKYWIDLNSNRCKLLNILIPKHGGTIIKNIININLKSIAIVSEFITKIEFQQIFTKQNQNKLIFVTPEYITSSLKYQKKLSFQEFIPKSLRETGKIIENTEIKTETKTKTDNNNNNNYNSIINSNIFACQIENDGKNVNYNSNISSIFDEMISIYNSLGDKWRAYSYKKANGFIKKYYKKIENEKDISELMKIKGFSKKLGIKVKEIVKNGKLRKLNELKSMPQIKTIKLFTNIFGVGSTTAQKWYNLGLRTLDDLKNNNNIKLSKHQQIGLKYYDDLLHKIPRCEVHEIEKFVCLSVNEVCSGCTVITCGSYRRGKLFSGDVDILITNLNYNGELNGLLIKIVNKLKDIQFIYDDLALPTGNNKHANEYESYMGICKLMDNKYKYYRHIDLRIYKPQHFPFAVLYFTGSDHFNRSMRYYAKKKGYTLSDTKLAPAIRVNNDKVFVGQPIKCKTEQQIFKALGLKYIKPTDRNTYENFGQSFDSKNNNNDNNNDNDNCNHTFSDTP